MSLNTKPNATSSSLGTFLLFSLGAPHINWALLVLEKQTSCSSLERCSFPPQCPSNCLRETLGYVLPVCIHVDPQVKDTSHHVTTMCESRSVQPHTDSNTATRKWFPFSPGCFFPAAVSETASQIPLKATAIHCHQDPPAASAEAPFDAGVSAPALSFPQGLNHEAKQPRDDILRDGSSHFICSVVALADSKSR